MNLRLRVVSCDVRPSDTSGFHIEIEVADAHEALAQVLSKEQLLNSTEDRLRWLFGDRQFEEDAACGQRAIDAAFIQCGMVPPQRNADGERAGED